MVGIRGASGVLGVGGQYSAGMFGVGGVCPKSGDEGLDRKEDFLDSEVVKSLVMLFFFFNDFDA